MFLCTSQMSLSNLGLQEAPPESSNNCYNWGEPGTLGKGVSQTGWKCDMRPGWSLVSETVPAQQYCLQLAFLAALRAVGMKLIST